MPKKIKEKGEEKGEEKIETEPLPSFQRPGSYSNPLETVNSFAAPITEEPECSLKSLYTLRSRYPESKNDRRSEIG